MGRWVTFQSRGISIRSNQAYIEGVTTYRAAARYNAELTNQFTVENLADKDYWNTAGNDLPGVGAPRTGKLNASVSF